MLKTRLSRPAHPRLRIRTRRRSCRIPTAAEKLGFQYFYDEAGSLLFEQGTGGANSTGRSFYVHLPTPSGPMPIAVYLDAKHYAVHTDHLNTPRRLTNSSQQPVWQWAFSAFGDEVPTKASNRFVDPATTPNAGTTTVADVTFNLRYPGQYFDKESGLSYNYFRSYDAKTGRYTQSDPIDLDGGWNKFGYALQNPLTLIDPSGLQVPGSWQTIFRGVPSPIPTSAGIDIASPSSDCVKDYLKNYYGTFVSDTLVPGFSAISYVPGSGFAANAWQTTAISGGAKGIAAIGVPAFGYYNMYAPGGSYNLGVNLVNGSKVAGSGLAVAGVGATSFATAAHTMAITACSCRR
jgi:RHS repeat-associated protein